MASGSIQKPWKLDYTHFMETAITLYSGQTIAAHGAINGDVTATNPGYYPVAISGWSAGGSNSGFVIPGRMYFYAKAVGSVTIRYNFQNGADSPLTSQSFVARVMWVKV